MTSIRAAQAELTRTAFRTLNSVVKPAVIAGAGNPLHVGGGAIVLEVTGRVSGEPRQVPLLATRLGDKMMVSTVRSDSQWLRNIEAHPNVIVHLYGKRRAATAEVTRGPLNTVAIALT
jgi:deazaflavin-dependent oxidoreductase (nitroreductase family)